MPTRLIPALLLALALAAAGLAVVLLAGGDDPSRRQEVRERGASVMPFSLEATTHTFTANPTGGVQEVLADDPRDKTTVRLIREHLSAEAAAFEDGDFGDPASIHGTDMPGLRELSHGHSRIDVEYRLRPAGAALSYRTADPSLAGALARWFDAQLGDHGSDARRGGDTAGSHHDGEGPAP